MTTSPLPLTHSRSYHGQYAAAHGCEHVLYQCCTAIAPAQTSQPSTAMHRFFFSHAYRHDLSAHINAEKNTTHPWHTVVPKQCVSTTVVGIGGVIANNAITQNPSVEIITTGSNANSACRTSAPDLRTAILPVRHTYLYRAQSTSHQ